jgi:hypothetical protein
VCNSPPSSAAARRGPDHHRQAHSGRWTGRPLAGGQGGRPGAWRRRCLAHRYPRKCSFSQCLLHPDPLPHPVVGKERATSESTVRSSMGTDHRHRVTPDQGRSPDRRRNRRRLGKPVGLSRWVPGERPCRGWAGSGDDRRSRGKRRPASAAGIRRSPKAWRRLAAALEAVSRHGTMPNPSQPPECARTLSGRLDAGRTALHADLCGRNLISV